MATRGKASSTSKPIKAILFGDTHVPYHTWTALNVVEELICKLKPDVIVHMGDLIDCWQISRFEKDPRRRDHLQDNINEAVELLNDIGRLAPKARKYFLEGNHEHRLSRTINSMSEANRVIAGLDVFEEYIKWPAILAQAGLHDWSFVGVREQSKTEILPRLILKHGDVARKWSGYSACAEWLRYGKSGASGHTHRLGVFYHRDFNGAHGWVETGCTCDLNPEYMSDPDWQHGCVVVTFAEGRFNFEPVYIQDGVGVWRGELI